MSTKIVVLKMNRLIKVGALCLGGAALLVLLAFCLIPKESEQSAYIPGTYTSNIILNNRAVSVSVTVTENEIADIELSGLDEVQAVFYPLFEPTMYDVANEVIELQSTDISMGAENSQTAAILLSAIDKALEKAER